MLRKSPHTAPCAHLQDPGWLSSQHLAALHKLDERISLLLCCSVDIQKVSSPQPNRPTSKLTHWQVLWQMTPGQTRSRLGCLPCRALVSPPAEGSCPAICPPGLWGSLPLQRVGKLPFLCQGLVVLEGISLSSRKILISTSSKPNFHLHSTSPLS